MHLNKFEVLPIFFSVQKKETNYSENIYLRTLISFTKYAWTWIFPSKVYSLPNIFGYYLYCFKQIKRLKNIANDIGNACLILCMYKQSTGNTNTEGSQKSV